MTLVQMDESIYVSCTGMWIFENIKTQTNIERISFEKNKQTFEDLMKDKLQYEADRLYTIGIYISLCSFTDLIIFYFLQLRSQLSHI